MSCKKCSKTGRFLPRSARKTPSKIKKGGMFAPNVFQYLGDAMRNPAGAAARPPIIIMESDSESDDEDERMQEMMMRNAPMAGGKQKGGVLGIAAGILALNPNFLDQVYQLLNSIGLERYTNAVGAVASKMISDGMFKYQNNRIVPTAAGKQTIQTMVEQILGRNATVELERIISTRLAALFNFVVHDGEGKILYPARLR